MCKLLYRVSHPALPVGATTWVYDLQAVEVTFFLLESELKISFVYLNYKSSLKSFLFLCFSLEGLKTKEQAVSVMLTYEIIIFIHPYMTLRLLLLRYKMKY